MRSFLASMCMAVIAGSANAAQPAKNASVDPDHIFVPKAVESPVTTITEPIPGSDLALHITYVETVDGLYTPVGVMKPEGNGPFPLIVFAHMNGGLGNTWIREWTQYGNWTLEQFVKAGYAVAWMRYRAEVKTPYGSTLEEGEWQGRQIFSRGPFEYEDAMAIIKHVKTLPYVDPERVGYVGLSHGGEMLMKIASEYNGIRAGIASEPAAMDYIAKKPPAPGAVEKPETSTAAPAEEQAKAVTALRGNIDLATAQKRVDTVKTPIFVQGRDRDHNQDVFRLSYELLRDAGKQVEWKSYDHEEHGFLFVRRGADGKYNPDPIQLEAVKDSLAYFDKHMK